MVKLLQSLLVGLIIVHSSAQLSTNSSQHRCCASIKVSQSQTTSSWSDFLIAICSLKTGRMLELQWVWPLGNIWPIEWWWQLSFLVLQVNIQYIMSWLYFTTWMQGIEPSGNQRSSVFAPDRWKLADCHHLMPWTRLVKVPTKYIIILFSFAGVQKMRYARSMFQAGSTMTTIHCGRPRM